MSSAIYPSPGLKLICLASTNTLNFCLPSPDLESIHKGTAQHIAQKKKKKKGGGHKFHPRPQAEKKEKRKEKSQVVNTEITEEERFKKLFHLSCKEVCCSKGKAYSVLFNLNPC